MKTFKNYLSLRLRETSLMTLVFTLLSIILTLAGVMEEAFSPHNHIAESEYCINKTGIYIIAVVLGIFTTIIPVLETAGFKNRRNLDTLYFLPISRLKLALAHYVSGFIQVFVIYTAAFITAGLYLINFASCFKLAYLPLYYVVSLLIGLVIYSFFIFIFGNANTVIDGIIFCVMWMFAIWLAASSFFGVLENYIYIFFSVDIEPEKIQVIPALEGLYDFCSDMLQSIDWWIVYVPINNCTMIFQNLIEERDEIFMSQVETIISQSYMFAVWGAIGIASAYGYFKNFIGKKVENVGEISNTGLGYKLLIPLYGYIIMASDDDSIGFKFMIWALMIAGYVIYQRGIKFKMSDIICLSIGFMWAIWYSRSYEIQDFAAGILFFGAPIAAIIWLGFGIYRLNKTLRKSKENDEKPDKTEMTKKIIGIVLSSLLLILSVFAIVSSIVFTILN